MRYLLLLLAALLSGQVLRAQTEAPLVTRLDSPEAPDGLEGNHIALWDSHGYYYNENLKKWTWQRPALFGTMEDLFPAAYVIDFLTPMLENAGAVVLMPRERDTSTEEVFPKAKLYGKWASDGTATTKLKEQGAPSAHFNASFKTGGSKAVYVRYKADEEAPDNVLYRVNSLDGTKEFEVNQTIGDGLWVYLGTFNFASGSQKKPVVEVVAVSDLPGTRIDAGEVKIGGGMGTVSHGGKVSGMPRWAEGAKYYLEWAGIPDSVVSRGSTEYKEDYMCRGRWVNYLAGGSQRIPHSTGLGIPIDLSLAFHTDAGVSADGTIGTLPIVCTAGDTLGDGTSRVRSIDYARSVQAEVVNDTRRLFNHAWRSRGLMDKHYHEASSPKVPALLLELLSHQNFGDMLLGLDPEYQFVAARAVYKGMLKFLANRDRRNYVVQPLPVNSFMISGNKGKYKLTWKPTKDPVEPTADAEYYVVYERVDQGGFEELAVVEKPSLDLKVDANKLYSYKVIAVNSGGSSFPSEILSVGYVPGKKPQVLVVNGFYSTSLPRVVNSKDSVGFDYAADHGAGYLRNISFVGEQTGFALGHPHVSDSNPGTGKSKITRPGYPIAGNSFDYPRLHGKSIMEAGYSFVSTSSQAYINNKIKAPIIDIILGKQGGVAVRHPAFSDEMKQAINRSCASGSSIMVSGSYIGTELFNDTTGRADPRFASETLGLVWSTEADSTVGRVNVVNSSLQMFRPASYQFNQELRDDSYAAETVDAFLVRGESVEIMRYPANLRIAATAFRSPTHKAVTMGFPFETIKSEPSRNQLMKQVLTFLSSPNPKQPKVEPKKQTNTKKKKKK